MSVAPRHVRRHPSCVRCGAPLQRVQPSQVEWTRHSAGFSDALVFVPQTHVAPLQTGQGREGSLHQAVTAYPT